VKIGAHIFSFTHNQPELMILSVEMIFSILFCANICISGAQAAAVPAPPAHYIYADKNFAVPDAVVKALQHVSIKHDRLAGEQIYVAFLSADGSGATEEDLVRSISDAWKIRRRGGSNSILVALFPESKKAFIENGYSLDNLVGNGIRKDILEKEILPRLQRGEFSPAAVHGTEKILEALESPLAASGEAARIFKNALAASGHDTPPAQEQGGSMAVLAIAVLFAIAVLAFAVFHIMSAETLYCRSGPCKPRPWPSFKYRNNPDPAGGSVEKWHS